MVQSTFRARLLTIPRLLSAATLVGLPCVATVARADAELTAVVTSGEPAPGVEGATFWNIGEGPFALSGGGLYHIGGSGKLAFAAALKKDGDYATGVWTRDGDSDELHLALEPDFLDEENDRCSDVLEGPFPLADGNLVILCSIPNGASPAAESLFYGPPGAVELQIPNGSAAPGDTETPFTFFTIDNIKVREPGIVAFDARLSSETRFSGTAGTGVWVWSPDSFEYVLATGAPAPGVRAQHVVAVRLDDVTSSGRVLLSGRRSGSAEAVGLEALWAGSSSADVSLVAASDDPTTLETESLAYDSAWLQNDLMDDGRVIVHTPSRSNGTSHAAWVGIAGESLAPLSARNGSRLTPASIPIAVTPKGKVALAASYTPERSGFASGLWVGTPENLTMIAKTGSPLRGMSDAVLDSVTSIQMNEREQMVLEASIKIDGVSRQRLLRYSPAAGFESIVEPDAIIDDHGTERAIDRYLDFCDTVNGKNEHCLDEDGRFVFLVYYSDQTNGLIITDPMPEGGAHVALAEPANSNPTGEGGSGGAGGATDSAGASGEDGEGGSAASGARGPGTGQGGTGSATGGSQGTEEPEAGKGGTAHTMGGKTGSPAAGAPDDNDGGDDDNDSDGGGCSVGGLGSDRTAATNGGLMLLAAFAARLARRRRKSARQSSPGWERDCRVPSDATSPT